MQSFLGMIADLSKFISQLSEQTHQLRELVKKNSNWDFTVTHGKQFEKLRSVLMRTFLWNFSSQSNQQKLFVSHPNLELVQLLNKNMRTIGIL